MRAHDGTVKAKFHYAIQVAHMVSDLSQTGSQLAFDQLSTGLRRTHDTHTQVCILVGDLVSATG